MHIMNYKRICETRRLWDIYVRSVNPARGNDKYSRFLTRDFENYRISEICNLDPVPITSLVDLLNTKKEPINEVSLMKNISVEDQLPSKRMIY